MTIEIERLSADDYRPKHDLDYVDVYNLHRLFDSLAFKSNLVLVGPKGIGKSLALYAFARKRTCPIITFDCSEDVRRSHLLGTFILRGEESPFILGPITTAFEIANEVGECILCLEEINSLTPQMQKVVNPAADFRRKVEVPEARRVFELRSGAKLWIVGTMNTTVYGGVYQLNEDLKSRFRMVPLDYPSPEDLRTIVNAAASELPDRRTVEHVLTLATETQTGALEYPLSPRDVVQILEDACRVGTEDALWLASGKFEDDDRVTVGERIQSTFGIQLKNLKTAQAQQP
jgi:nitric oxide reductase NorQ protein